MNASGRRFAMRTAMAFLGCWLALCASAGWAAAPAVPLAQAHWIAAKADAASAPEIAKGGEPSGAVFVAEALPIFRRGFTAKAGARLIAATLYVSGLGQFEAHINGHNVTETVFTPGWSDYRKRIYYDRYDVKSLIRPGENAIGVMLGNGMYNVESPVNRYTKFRGSFGQPKLILELRLRFANGSEQAVVSDGAWKTAPGPITFTSIYGGEDYDARREQAGWDGAHFDDKAWVAVNSVASPGGMLMLETIPPMVANETYTPVGLTHPKPGEDVYDLGENMAGWPEIEVSGAAGGSVRLLSGELLDKNGMVTQRSADAGPKNPNFFTYTLRGGGTEAWHPRFSYYGFRYVQVERTAASAGGALPEVTRIDGRFLHDAVSTDGTFTSSSDLLNRVHTLIDRAILSNTVSVLTDCPHREKLGWLEQTHLAGPSLMYNYGFGGLYAKMAGDIRDAQHANGMIPSIAPEYPNFGGAFEDSPEWGAAGILSPWTAYQFYGDMGMLREQYDAMKRYAAYLHGKAGETHLLTYGLGDWYDIGPKPPGVEQLTSAGVTASAVYFQELNALARIATLLGHADDAAGYTRDAGEVKVAYNARFFRADTERYDTGSQTADAMPLVVGLVPAGHEAGVLASLVADIHAHNDHVTAGDVGFHYVVRALTDGGRSDVLYAMLIRTDKPSYGEQVAHGATTLTEAWDANPASSQNHFMLGHAEEWFYRGLAGIDFDMSREGDERIRIQPSVVGDLTSASATYKSKLGPIASAWKRDGDTVRMELTIPAGATAKVLFPPEFRGSILLNGKPLAAGGKVLRANLENSTPHCYVVAGTYHFEVRR